MRYVKKEQIQSARKVNLYDYLIKNHGELFVPEGVSIHLKDKRSISIRRDFSGYKDFASGEHGNSIDFLTKYLGYSLDKAVLSLCDQEAPVILGNNYNQAMRDNDIPPQFPRPISEGYKHLYAYLMKRGISADTISMLIDQKLLYQDENNNIVFANKERDWGERRGTNTYADTRCIHRSECPKFKPGEREWCKAMNECSEYKKDAFRGMIARSRPDGFWWFQIGESPAEWVFICEGSIDAISLFELHKKDGVKLNAVYASIGGVAKQSAIDRLKHHPGVILAVDNDAAGDNCRNHNSDIPYILPTNKDWNEDLMARK